MVHEIGVERVVARDQHHQRLVATPARAPRLLPERRPGAGEARHHDGVQAGDVHPELERVRGGHAEQVAVHQRRLEGAPLLGQVAAAVGRHAGDQRGVDLGEHALRAEGGQLRPPARSDERQRAGTLDDEVGQHPRGLGPGGAADGCPVLPDQLRQQRRLPQRHRPSGRGRSVVDDGSDLASREPSGEPGRVGHRRRGQHQRRPRPVPRADTQEPPQQQGNVRPEQPPVGVALVEHHVAQAAQEGRPAGVLRQQRAVHHVRVAEQPARVAARPVPLGVRSVPVERRGPDIGQPERLDCPQLVGGQRLGRREVQRRRAPVVGERRQHRQLVGQRLPRRGPGGHHDVVPGVREVGCAGLMAPRPVNAPFLERGAHRGRDPERPVDGASGAGGQLHDVAQRVVPVAGVGSGHDPPQQAFPAPLDHGDDAMAVCSHAASTTLASAWSDQSAHEVGTSPPRLTSPPHVRADTASCAIPVISPRARAQPSARGIRVSNVTTNRRSAPTAPALCR